MDEHEFLNFQQHSSMANIKRYSRITAMNYHSDILHSRKLKKCVNYIDMNPGISSWNLLGFFLMLVNTYLAYAILFPFST